MAGGAGVVVAPDNGLIAPAVAMAGGPGRAVELTDPAYHLASPGGTFAGRDVFAPVAAHLCNGVSLEAFGPSVEPASLVPGVIPVPREERGALVAEVLWVDRFGNAQLNVGPEDLSRLGGRGAPDLGGQRAHGPPGHLLRRDRDGGDRLGARLLRADGGGPDAELGRRRAGSRSGRRDHAHHRRQERAGRDDGARGARRAGRPAADATAGVRTAGTILAAVRPATTLALALLLVAIVVAGVASLVLMG